MKPAEEIATPGTARVLVAFASLSALLFALVLAAAPGLHAHVCDDAARPQHKCAVGLVKSGSELPGSDPLLTAPQPAAQFSTLPALHSAWVAPLFLGAHVFAHAPPALS